ncbi:hypothetical protein NE236_19475 [Actinoallomurus purpureus]|uniref:hypothetical protein n=1 Tax=Actinoallomurus purpureus TaxID=478114 RepID=UPI0020922A8A|nr:hypothetical protein [Actinoallomurus purpureus]MCO6007166.1 hypothetical protein [Actinoallomurus purpureus]
MRSRMLAASAAAVLIPAATTFLSGMPAAEASTICHQGAIKASWSNSFPTAHRPGQSVTVRTTLYNKTGTTLRGLFFDYSIGVPPNHNHWGPTPTVSWRWGHGSWHRFGLSRNNSSPQHDWYSEDHTLGALYAHKSKTLQFKVAFHKGDPTGTYSGIAMIGARATCGITLLAVAGNLGPAYRP